jgi:hypothetical protein
MHILRDFREDGGLRFVGTDGEIWVPQEIPEPVPIAAIPVDFAVEQDPEGGMPEDQQAHDEQHQQVISVLYN